MATNTTYAAMSKLHFVVDQSFIGRDSTGKQIDWALVANVKFGMAGSKRVPAGTLMNIVTATGKLSPTIEATAGSTKYGILLTDASENNRSDSLSGYGVAISVIAYEQLMPDFSEATWATLKAGFNTNIQFVTYQDSR